MTGYQEVLTDPSYAGQLVTLTYPLVGNYGINPQDFESSRIQVGGLIVRENCDQPSHGRSTQSLHEFLASEGIPGISAIDTRAVTKRLRSQGVMLGVIASGDPDVALKRLQDSPSYDEKDYVATVTTGEEYDWNPTDEELPEIKHHIVVTDCGLKYNILRQLRRRGCRVTIMPAATPAEVLLAMNPSGMLFSPGPGDPKQLDYVVDNTRQILGRVPVMGICLGHICSMYGKSLEYAWNMYAICIEYVWNMFGICTSNPLHHPSLPRSRHTRLPQKPHASLTRS